MTSKGTKTLKPQAALKPIPTAMPSNVSIFVSMQFFSGEAAV
jgi:hypothetical protein